MNIDWSTVGGWIKDNAGEGATLIGSLLTGNVPAAVAAGVSMVSSATGTDDPNQALERLQTDPKTTVRLRELAVENERSIRSHIEAMERLRLEDRQAAHSETQQTIRAGDQAEGRFVRWTRPGQSWLSLAAAIGYVFTAESIEPTILAALLALPGAYAGLREIGKGVNVVTERRRRSQA